MAGGSKNILEEVWLAWAFDSAPAVGVADAGLGRVEAHYGSLYEGGLEARTCRTESLGLALWRRRDPRLRWPLWHQDGELAIGCSAVPGGWSRLADQTEPSAAPQALARALRGDPARASGELAAPFVIGVVDLATPMLTIVNDALGAGHIYEMRTPAGRVWSNRLGALPVFAGVEPSPDERAWRVFGAAGWFLGADTPIEGARKVAPGSVITVTETAMGADARLVAAGARERLVEPRRARLSDSADRAAEDALRLARDMSAAWDTPIAISLTGGRDSRVSAAAAIAAGIDATFNTGDFIPGELDVVRELIAAAPRAMRHEVNRPEPEREGDGDLAGRVAGIHLMHDGMRNPQELRRPTELPHRDFLPPTFSGHGGELGHGFYYGRKEKLRRLQKGGDEAIADQLNRNARRRHSAATEDAYRDYLDECDRTLEGGRGAGLEGPVLLDYFYLAQRLPYRSGLGTRSARNSPCVTPGFVRGAFDLRPKDRLSAKLHREVIARLVPEWRKVGFFAGEADSAMPETYRARIWERDAEASALEEIIAAGEGWPRFLREERIKEMWLEVRSGRGSADYEHVFDRVVWRAGFEEHMRRLAAASGARP